MSIDDYIDTYKSYANDYEKGRYEMVWSSQQRDYAIGRAREYRQLAEWLEELKDLRKWKEQGRAEAIADCMTILKAQHMVRTCEDDYIPKIEIPFYRNLWNRFKQLKEQNND